MKTRVLLVDDHRIVRRGLRLLVELSPEWTVVAEATDGPSALAAIREHHPEIIVMDLHLPGTDGLKVSAQALAEFPKLKIILLSGDVTKELVDEAVRTGIQGYVLKGNDPDELPRAMTAVRSGKLYLSPEVTDLVMTDYRQTLINPPVETPALSEQEVAVLRLLAQGLRTKEIASQMKLSVKTVETYRRRVCKKVGLQSVAELTRYAIKKGLISL